jgi:tripartite-type tricarboxylate transporter receptor subunit TctC
MSVPRRDRPPGRPNPAPSTRRHLVLAAAALGAAALGPARAQSWPSRPLRLIAPFPPGGPTDIIGRMYSAKLAERLGQSVVFDNRAGAGGIIGTEAVARSEPDGYTLLLGTIGTHGINSAIYRKLPYDPVKDFAPVALVATPVNLLVVHPSVPANTLQELIAIARAKPGDLSYASAGIGSTPHLAGELLQSMARIEMVHVPYKGGGQAIPDVVSGKVSMMFLGIPALQDFVRGGRLRPIAVASLQRAPAMPEVPTVAESGLPGFEVGAWHAVFAPAGTPRPVVDRLATELAAISDDAEVRSRLAAMGAIPLKSTPDELSRYVASELDKFAKLVRDAKIPQQ